MGLFDQIKYDVTNATLEEIIDPTTNEINQKIYDSEIEIVNANYLNNRSLVADAYERLATLQLVLNSVLSGREVYDLTKLRERSEWDAKSEHSTLFWFNHFKSQQSQLPSSQQFLMVLNLFIREHQFLLNRSSISNTLNTFETNQPLTPETYIKKALELDPIHVPSLHTQLQMVSDNFEYEDDEVKEISELCKKIIYLATEEHAVEKANALAHIAVLMVYNGLPEPDYILPSEEKTEPQDKHWNHIEKILHLALENDPEQEAALSLLIKLFLDYKLVVNPSETYENGEPFKNRNEKISYLCMQLLNINENSIIALTTLAKLLLEDENITFDLLNKQYVLAALVSHDEDELLIVDEEFPLENFPKILSEQIAYLTKKVISLGKEDDLDDYYKLPSKDDLNTYIQESYLYLAKVTATENTAKAISIAFDGVEYEHEDFSHLTGIIISLSDLDSLEENLKRLTSKRISYNTLANVARRFYKDITDHISDYDISYVYEEIGSHILTLRKSIAILEYTSNSYTAMYTVIHSRAITLLVMLLLETKAYPTAQDLKTSKHHQNPHKNFVELLRKAIKLDPTNEDALMLLAHLYKSNNLKPTMEDLGTSVSVRINQQQFDFHFKILKVNPHNAYSLFEMGRLLAEDHDNLLLYNNLHGTRVETAMQYLRNAYRYSEEFGNKVLLAWEIDREVDWCPSDYEEDALAYIAKLILHSNARAHESDFSDGIIPETKYLQAEKIVSALTLTRSEVALGVLIDLIKMNKLSEYSSHIAPLGKDVEYQILHVMKMCRFNEKPNKNLIAATSEILSKEKKHSDKSTGVELDALFHSKESKLKVLQIYTQHLQAEEKEREKQENFSDSSPQSASVTSVSVFKPGTSPKPTIQTSENKYSSSDDDSSPDLSVPNWFPSSPGF